MDDLAGNGARRTYAEPQISDYGTLAQLTGDMVFMRHVGVTGGAMLLATAPASPGGGVDGIDLRGSGDAGGAVLGAEAAAPGGEAGVGESGELGALGGETGGEAGVAGTTAAGGEGVAGADELPFTGLDAAATAAAGAATLAAGAALRKATSEEG